MFLRRLVETHRQRVVGADSKVSKFLTRRSREDARGHGEDKYGASRGVRSDSVRSGKNLVSPWPRASSLLLRVKNLLADLASPETLGVANADHRPRPGGAWFVALVWLRPKAAL
jgi:hypothetical protein